MFRRRPDQVLEEIIRENARDGHDVSGPAARRSFSPFRRTRKAVAFTAEPTPKSRDRRSDLTIAALGVTLGLICALFPWYIFFNPDEFGVRAMRFGGNTGGTEPILLGPQPERIGAPIAVQEISPLQLDLLATGSSAKEADDEEGTSGLSEQPFPPPVIAFKLIQIANGRAMLEDETGLFVVQPGSLLPDGARVKAIEERDGRPVLVTDAGTVLEISE